MSLRIALASLLLAAAAVAAPAQEYRIAGRVLNAVTGSPVPGAQVSLSPVTENSEPFASQQPPPTPGFRGRTRRPPQTGFGGGRSTLGLTTSAEDGAFHFDHLAPAKYSLSCAKRGYITAAYDEHDGFSTAIVTGPGLDSEHLDFKLSPGAVISGTVADTSGDPIEQGSVILFRQQDDGFGSVRQYRTATPDDSGFYEFTRLPAGTYFVAANARVWYATPPTDQSAGQGNAHSDLDLAYPLTYFANSTDSATATPIPVKGGEHLPIDLSLHAVPAVHLTLPAAREPGEDGQGRGGRGFPMFPMATQEAFGEPTYTRPPEPFRQTGSARDSSSYSYSLAPGQYKIEMGGRLFAVDASADVRVDSAAGQAMATVTGKVALDLPPNAAHAEDTLPDGMSITLRRAGGSDTQVVGQIGPNGAFSIERVPFDTYEVLLQAEGRLYAATRMAATGATVDGSLLKISSESVMVAATVSPASSRVSGFVRRAPAEASTGNPAGTAVGVGGVMVVLVPRHSGERALYRRDQSDSDGSFVLRDVAPGEYTVVAIEDGWDLEWANPAVIRRYLRNALEVTIDADTKIQLKGDVHPQPR